MADIELRYGPGASVAILKTSLKAMGFRAKLEVDVEEVDGELEDAIHLHLGPRVGEEGATRLPKTLSLCYRIFEKRTVKLSADVGSGNIELEIPPGQTTAHYRAAIERFCAGVADHRRGAH